MTQKWLTMAEAEAYSGYGRKTLIAKAMAGLIGVHPTLIGKIKRRIIWAHVA